MLQKCYTLTVSVLCVKERKKPHLKTHIMMLSPPLGVPQWPVSLHAEEQNYHKKGAKEPFQKQETVLV